MKDVNRHIVHWRKVSGFNQTDIAEKLGIKTNTYSQMERTGTVSAERLFKLAEIFGIKPCQLYYGEELCKPEPLPPVPEITEGQDVLKNPPPAIPEPEVFFVTNKEESLIKILRNLSKANKDAAIKYVEALYHQEKYGK